MSGSTQSCGCQGRENRQAERDRRKANAMTPQERLERRKVWNKTYKERHPEKRREISRLDNLKRKEQMRQWREENAEQYKSAKREWYERNKEVSCEKARKYAREHPEWKAAQCAKRRARKKRAMPPWADEKRMQVLYEKAGEYGMTVDHIVPLKSDKVCGLHCWENLQLLAPELNSAKMNRYWPDMWDALEAC